MAKEYTMVEILNSWDDKDASVCVTSVQHPVALTPYQIKVHTRGYSAISWDWKSRPDLGDLRDALEPLGIRVYQDPLYVGSDQFGYIFARRPLTDAELAAIGDRNCEDD